MTTIETESDIYTRVMENLRMAEEAAYILGHFYKAQDDFAHGQGLLAVGELLKMTQHNITNIATKSLRQAGGFR